MKRKLTIPLLARIVIAIGLGIGIGYVAPLWAARLSATFNSIFGQFLGFLIPLIIFGFVTPAIAEIGSKAGKMLLATVGIAYGATIFAGFTSYFTSAAIFPSLISSQGMQGLEVAEGAEILPYFTIQIPPLMPVTTALVLAFIVGLGAAFLKGDAIKKGCSELRDIVARVIAKVIIPLLPVYIFGIFLNMTYTGQTAPILAAFVKIIAVIFGLQIALLLFQYSLAGAITHRNPLKMLRTMLPAYFTALGTQSSAATIPVTMRQSIKMGVSEETSGFVVPLCATIHMSGSALKITACSVAMLILHGMPFDFGMFAHFVLMIGVTIVAAPGIPGGVIMASLGLLSSILGFTDAQNALMIALYITMDSFGTACNVTGDGAIAAVIDKIFPRREQNLAA